MLPTYNSPPSALLSSISVWNAFEDDKLLFFDLPSAKTPSISQLSLVQSDQPWHPCMYTVEMYWVKVLASGAVSGSQTSGQAVSLDPAGAPVTVFLLHPLSLWEKLRMVVREKVKASWFIKKWGEKRATFLILLSSIKNTTQQKTSSLNWAKWAWKYCKIAFTWS